jgi:hypothetical protein
MAAAADGTRVGVHPAASYPDPVRAELARRREQLLVRATGQVLDLDVPGVVPCFEQLGATRLGSAGEAVARTAGPLVHDLAPPRPDGAYDTVVATGVLAGFADLGAITSALAALVADGGALLFVEPVGVPGWAHVLRTSIPDPRRRRAPWRALALDRDVPAAVRATGLVVCDLARGELPDQHPSLRHWVSGRAVRIPGV